MAAERVDLYWHIPPSGRTIPLYVTLFLLKDSVPNKDEVNWEVRRLCLKCYGGIPGMLVEHLRQWLRDVTRVYKPDNTHWRKVVVIVQMEFRDGTLINDITWKMAVWYC